MNTFEDSIFWNFCVEKAYRSKDDDGYYIEGIASTDDPDEQGEVLVPAGLDCSYLGKSGKLKWDHGNSPDAFIGKIVDYRVDRHSLWVKAKLYKGIPDAERLWQIMKNNPDHGLGFSVEGGVLARDRHDKKKIIKAAVRHVALTAQPVNTNSFATICKSFAKALSTSYQICNQTGGQAMVPESPYGIVDIAGPKFKVAQEQFEQFLSGVRAGDLQVLDGTPSYFRLRGLDDQTSRFLADYVRENLSAIVTKSHGGSNMDYLELLEKSLDESLEKSDSPAGDDGGKKDEEELVKCMSCGQNVKTGETCEACGEPLEKALDDDAGDDSGAGGGSGGGDEDDPMLLDVTDLLKSIEEHMDGEGQATNVLAKALLRSHEENKVLAEQMNSLAKSVGAIAEKVGLLSKTPAPRLNNGEPRDRFGSEVSETEKDKLNKAFNEGKINPHDSIAFDRGRITPAQLISKYGL